MRRFAFLVLFLLLLSSFGYAGWWDTGEYTADANTLALYHCNQSSGTVVTDATGNYHAIATSSSIWDTTNKKWGSGGCGTDATYYITQATLFDSFEGGAFTWEAWIMPLVTFQTGAGYHSFLYKFQTAGCKIVSYFSNTTGKLVVNWECPGSANFTSTTTSWTAGVWYHIAIIWDGTNAALYVNGNQESVSAEPAVVRGSDYNFFIGSDHTGGDLANAVFDEIAISDCNRFALSWWGGEGGTPVPTDIIDVNAWRIEGYDDSGQYPTFRYVNDANLTIDFNVFNKDNNRMLVDINYGTSNTQGTGTPIVSDLNLTSGVCADQNFEDSASCHWDWNISAISDGNYYLLFDANTNAGNYAGQSSFATTSKTFHIGSTTLTMRFVDENKYIPIAGLSVLVDGITYTTDSAGKVSIGVDATTSRAVTVKAWKDDNYSIARYIEFDANIYSNYDFNVLMLHDFNGLDFNFRFYEADGTTLLPNTRLRVYANDNNYASIRTTDASGYVSFFLSPDQNYYFVTPIGYKYETITVTLNLPKNEATLASISPYDAEMARLAKGLFLNKTTTVPLQMFPNTVEYYQLDINAGLTYYSRKYEVNYKGNPITAIFQPYLVLVADGVSSIFYTKEALTLETEPNTLIKVYKTIVGAGTVEVQSTITDDAGTASMSFIIDDEYTFYFYDSAGTLLSTKTLRPNFTSYYVYVDTGTTTWTEPKVEYVTVSGFPNVGYVAFTSAGYDINVTVSATNGTISRSWLSVSNDDGNLSFNQACGSGCGYTVARKDMNATSWVKAEVYVVTASGLVYKTSWAFTPYDASGDNLLASLRGAKFRQEWGCSANANEPCFFLLIVSAFLTIGALAGAGAASHDASAMGIVTMIMLGIFTYLLWIPASVFILACIGAFAFMIVSRGGF